MAARAGVKVKGLKEMQRDFVKFSRIIGQGRKKPFQDAGKWAVKTIIEKTLSGKDFKGRPFAKYSPKYAKKKGSTTVDLFVSGKMLRAISFQAFAKKLRIYVRKKSHTGKISTYNLAIVQNFKTNTGRKHSAVNPEREFMGLTDRDIDKILNITRKFYEKELAKVF